MWSRFEALLGRRYLMRTHRRPRVLYIGLVFLTLGLIVMTSSKLVSSESFALWLSGKSDAGLFDPELFTLKMQLKQASLIVQGVGLGVIVISVCVTLFGFLKWWMTTFSAFSTFMIAIGVAEVLLVLGVMNGFQGYLREKLIDVHAHVTVMPPEDAEWIEGYRDLVQEISSTEGVYGVSPLLKAEVMLRVPESEATAAAEVFGVEASSIDQTVKLSDFIERGCGCLSDLDDASGLLRRLSEDPLTTVRHCAQTCKPLEQNTAGSTQHENLGAAVERTPKQTSAGLGQLMALPPPARAKPQPTIFLGTQLKYGLNLSLGDRFEVISPLGDIGPQGPMPKLRAFTLTGWISSGLPEVDAQHAYSPLSDIQRFLGVGDVVNEIRVRAQSIDAARALRDRLRAQLGGRATVLDWRDRYQSLFSALQLERIAMFLVLTINILLAAFSIMSTLVMSLVERKREISILRAMGAEARSIRRIFISQGLTAGIIGSLLGALIGGGACALLAYFGLPLGVGEVYNIPSDLVQVNLLDLLAIVVVAIGVSLISTIYPALYAANIQPIEGVKGR